METNFKQLLSIENSSIEDSFTRISMELFHNYSFRVNNFIFLFTEIEFYYFYDGIHEDISTHDHKFNQPSGRWRGHNQGIDITFEFTDVSDGGILIRGIKQHQPESKELYTNGPINVVGKIFECFNDVTTSNSGIFLSRLENGLNRKIYRTSRQGIKRGSYVNSKYRYYTEIENWGKLPTYYRKNIEKDSEPV